MNNPLYIVISGKKQHGKSTIAQFIYDELYRSGPKGWDREFFKEYVVETAFAEPLKKFCGDVFGFSEEDMETEQGKQKKTFLRWEDIYRPAVIQDWLDDRTGPMTIREVLQYFGSNICRNRFYYDIWSAAPFNKKWHQNVVIIPDCRFHNELDMARKNNAIIIRVNRPNMPIDNHISETNLDDEKWNDEILLSNSKDLDYLLLQVQEDIMPLIYKRL